jgi:hypothetical protein
VVNPKSEAEVIEVLRACYAHDVPVTTRGAGTGNYGQAMPMRGGCVLMHMKPHEQGEGGRTRPRDRRAGHRVKDLDAECAHSGQEQRMMPSTFATATIGGFVAGGSGGIGSCTWGALRDFGNIIRLRVVTMEAEPRVLDLPGATCPASPTPMAPTASSPRSRCRWPPAYDWVEFWSASTISWTRPPSPLRWPIRTASSSSSHPIEAPIPQEYFQRGTRHVLREPVGLRIMLVAPHRFDGLQAFMARRAPGDRLPLRRRRTFERKTRPSGRNTPGTTPRCARSGRSDDHLSAGALWLPRSRWKVAKVRETFGAEVLQHLEAMREDGKVMFRPADRALSPPRSGSRRSSDPRGDGLPIFNPHRYTLEEAWHEADGRGATCLQEGGGPKGLLNPGKMIKAWRRTSISCSGPRRWCLSIRCGTSAFRRS